jgi:hypothetical protein
LNKIKVGGFKKPMWRPTWLNTYFIRNIGLLLPETIPIFRHFVTWHCLKHLKLALEKEPLDLNFFERNNERRLYFYIGTLATYSLSFNLDSQEFLIPASSNWSPERFSYPYGIWLTKLLEAIRLHKILREINSCLTKEFRFSWNWSYNFWQHELFVVTPYFPVSPARVLCLMLESKPISKLWPVRLEPDLTIEGLAYPTLAEFMPAFRQWITLLFNPNQ